VGAFEQADGGTIFLDEIGECSGDMQAKLLRVLQPHPEKGPSYREFSRVGEAKPRHSDVRIIAATNRDIMDEVTRGGFREDLFYRLAVIKIKLPPLRERKSDIPTLVDHLLMQINEDFRKREEPGYRDKSISDAAKRFVRSYDWPGNVRQLGNTLVEAAVMASGDTIGVGDIKAAIADIPGQRPSSVADHQLGDGFCLQEFLEEIQRQYLGNSQ
jgi:DNA-binding NtrC family response regulator